MLNSLFLKTPTAPDTEKNRIKTAYDFAEAIHSNVSRSNGTSFFSHTIATAVRIAEWTSDPDLIVGALLHDVLDKENTQKPAQIKDLQSLAGKETAQIISLVHELGKTQQGNLFLGMRIDSKYAMSPNIKTRAFLLKLASGMDLAEGLKSLPSEVTRQARGRLLLSKYVPLAVQLGMWEYKRQLEDICLKAISPNEFQLIEKWRNQLLEKNKAKIDEFENILIEACERKGIKAEIIVHHRHVYSIFHKMSASWSTHLEELINSGKSIDQLIRFTVLVNSIDECYLALSRIHGVGYPVTGNLQDNIAIPSPNGYTSLQTAIQTKTPFKSTKLKISIRTNAMREMGGKGVLYLPERKLWLIPENATENLNDNDGNFRCTAILMEFLRNEHQWRPNRIHIFTPQGTSKVLPYGSTPLDFAYAVHTDIGHRFSYASVNHQNISIDHVLQDGDVVEIFTNPNANPKRDWLTYTVSGRARQKISHWLDTAPKAIGSDRLQHALEKLNLNMRMPDVVNKITNYASESGKTLTEFVESIGREEVEVELVVNQLFSESFTPSARCVILANTDQKSFKKPLKFAECCKPDYPDEIIGCLGQKHIMIHKSRCLNAMRAKLHVSVSWENASPLRIPVKITITGNDRPGLVLDIVSVIANHLYNIVDLHASVLGGIAEVIFVLELPTPAIPDGLKNDLGAVHGVTGFLIPEESLQYMKAHAGASHTDSLTFGAIGNPYSPGRPIFDKSMFFGRQQKIKSIIECLLPAVQPTSILLCAQRRAGKTSLAWRIKEDRRIRSAYLPIFMDLSTAKMGTDQTFLRKISMRLHTDVKTAGIEFSPVDISTPFREGYLQFENSLEQLRRKNGRHLLLIMDEFESTLAANHRGDLSDEFFINLRAWSQTQPITFLVVGSHQLEIEAPLRFPEFLNVFSTQRLGAFRPQEARRLILEPSRHRLTYNDDAIEMVLFLTACYPYYIHLVCARLYNQASETFKTRIEIEHVETVKDALSNSSSRGNYAHLWNSASLYQEIALVAIAHIGGENGWAKGVEIEVVCKDNSLALTNALHELCDLETLEKRTQDGALEFHIQIPLFTSWIVKNFSLPNLLSKR